MVSSSNLLTPYLPNPQTRAEKEWWHFTHKRHFEAVDVRQTKSIKDFYRLKLQNHTVHYGKEELIIPAGEHHMVVQVLEGEGQEAYLTDNLTIILEEEARLTHLRLLTGGETTRIHRCVEAHVAKDATYEQITLTQHAHVVRAETVVHLEGENAQTAIHTLQQTQGEAHHDHTLAVHHHVPHTHSNVQHKNSVDDKGHGIFQGCFYVAPQAQKTQAAMQCDTLLLGDQARTSHKPALEILADDVKCAHGASTGQLEEEALFYMQARGLTEAEARHMLTQAFVASWMEALPEQAQEIMHIWLEEAS